MQKVLWNRAQGRAQSSFWILEIRVPDEQPSAAENFGSVVEEDSRISGRFAKAETVTFNCGSRADRKDERSSGGRDLFGKVNDEN